MFHIAAVGRESTLFFKKTPPLSATVVIYSSKTIYSLSLPVELGGAIATNQNCTSERVFATSEKSKASSVRVS